MKTFYLHGLAADRYGPSFELAVNSPAEAIKALACQLPGGRTLRFADDGPGVSEGNRARIFDPFFTTRREAGGTGMGLPIVKRMLQAHGAEIALIAGEGAGFEITYD